LISFFTPVACDAACVFQVGAREVSETSHLEAQPGELAEAHATTPSHGSTQSWHTRERAAREREKKKLARDYREQVFLLDAPFERSREQVVETGKE
jgi:hypothetical protein